MYSLAKFQSRAGATGQPLPDPFPSFATRRITFRSGATSMLAGKPGSFKSVLALNMLSRWAAQGKTVLYFSADSDEFTVAKRVTAILTGDPAEAVEYELAQGRTKRCVRALKRLSGVHMVYRSTDMQGITDHAAAFEALYGTWPDVIFIDNLINYADSASDWGSMIEMTKELDIFARESHAHVCILHHARTALETAGGMPPADHEIQGKVTQIPRLVLTVGAADMALRIACVKNTNGPQDPTARRYTEFAVQPSLAVRDVTFERETGLSAWT